MPPGFGLHSLRVNDRKVRAGTPVSEKEEETKPLRL